MDRRSDMRPANGRPAKGSFWSAERLLPPWGDALGGGTLASALGSTQLAGGPERRSPIRQPRSWAVDDAVTPRIPGPRASSLTPKSGSKLPQSRTAAAQSESWGPNRTRQFQFGVRLMMAALSAVFAVPSHSEEARIPERVELWVPSKHLEEILRQHPNAVLLDRAQYEALIRDAGKVRPGEGDSKPPVDAVVEGVVVRGKVGQADRFADLQAEVRVRNLVDGWGEVPSPIGAGENIIGVEVDGEPAKSVFRGNASAILVRGKGRHVVRIGFRAPVRVDRGWHSFAFRVNPPVPLNLDIRTPGEPNGGAANLPDLSEWARHPARPIVIRWDEKEKHARQEKNLSVEIAALAQFTVDRLDTEMNVSLRDLNEEALKQWEATLPPGEIATSVEGANVRAWSQDGAVLRVTFEPGAGALEELVLRSTRPLSLETDKLLPVTLVPPRSGREFKVSGVVALTAGPGLELGSPENAFGAKIPVGKETRFAAAPGFWREFVFDSWPAAFAVGARRTAEHFSADVDTRIALATHEAGVERTIALHGEEGRVNRALLAAPAGEQFLGLDPVSGEHVEWKLVKGGVIEISWPKGLQKGQATTLRLRTRRDLGADVGEGRGSEKLIFENLKIADSIRLAGYVALDFDESWKVVTTETTGLEARDSRVTPVKGRMAWFTLRDHRLGLEISRNDPVLDVSFIGYALPRAKTVEIEGQLTLEVSRAPLRKLDVKISPAIAKLVHWDSPLVGSEVLDEATGTWRLTLRRELLGAESVRFHLSLPSDAAKPQGQGSDPQATTLSAALPNLELPSARRHSGVWVVEANTDTELRSEARGMQPLDALAPPAIEGYVPRHRVIAVFGFGGGDRELRLTATRHEPGALVNAVIEELNLASVLGSDGSSRHEAALVVKHNGQQFFGMRLPQGATLLGALVEGQPVKPVRAGEDEVRVPLSVRRDGSASVSLKITYELRGSAWGAGGTVKIDPPETGEGVPVLSSTWRVFAPKGMEIRFKDGALLQVERHQDITLLGELGRCLEIFTLPTFSKISPRGTLVMRRARERTEMELEMAALATEGKPRAAAAAEMMNRIILPTVQFQGATVAEAVEFLFQKSRDLDTMERDPQRRGFNYVIRHGAAPSTAKITLDLKDVPLSEALRYVTELAGMKYRVEANGVVITPVTDVATEQYTRTYKIPADFLSGGSSGKARSAVDALKAQGISFPDGSSAVYDEARSLLIVKNTQPNLDAVDGFFAPTGPPAVEVNKAAQGRLASAKSGLISLDLEVPRSGQAFEFRGHHRPAALVLTYQTWEQRMYRAALWALLGLALFFRFGCRRPWLGTFVAALSLTCLPLAFAPSWLAACNAVLAGWLAGFASFMVWRVARRVEPFFAKFRERAWDAAPEGGMEA